MGKNQRAGRSEWREAYRTSQASREACHPHQRQTRLPAMRDGWIVVDLNPERKVVKCPICNIPNDIKDAIKRAA